MGLFSSKKKTKVETSVMRVVEDDNIPDMLKSCAIRGVMKNTNITTAILEGVLNGPVNRFYQAYQYGKSGYYYGLPKITVQHRSKGTNVVKSAIESETGLSGIELEYYEFAPINHTHLGWQILTDDYGYDHQTNEITNLSAQLGATVYLDRITPVYNLPDGVEADVGVFSAWGRKSTWGYTPERVAQSPTSDLGNQTLNADIVLGPSVTDSVELQYVYRNNSGDLVKDKITIDLSGYDQEAEYYQVHYSHTDANGTKTFGYWTYIENGGIYPALQGLFAVDYVDPGTFFPFLVFRRHDTNRTADNLADTAEFKSAAKLAYYYGLDFKRTGDTIHENPDIEDIDQAVMMMAVPATSKDQMDIAYLFEFFSRLQGETINYTPDITDALVTRIAGNSITIRDADFKMVLSYKGIERRIKAGKLDNKYSNSVVSVDKEIWYEDSMGNQRVRIYKEKSRLYRKQIGTGIYEEIKVVDPQIRFDIYKDKSVVGGADDERMLIPLDKDILDTFQFLDREKLLYRSQHFVFNSRVTYKVKWYETGLFKALITVVAVVVTVLSAGSAWQSIVAAASIGIGAVVMTILSIVIEALVVEYAFKLVVEEIGLEAAFLVALAAALAGTGMKITNSGSSTWADNLVNLSSGLVRGSELALKDLTEDLLDDANAFSQEAQNKMAELNEAQKELDMQSLLDPTLFVGLEPLFIEGEDPDSYYNRTVHSGNVGRNGIDIVESFVDISLKLPDMSETMRGTI